MELDRQKPFKSWFCGKDIFIHSSVYGPYLFEDPIIQNPTSSCLTGARDVVSKVIREDLLGIAQLQGLLTPAMIRFRV